MPHWRGYDRKGDNYCSPTNPSNESEERSFKHGNFSNGAHEVSKEEQLAGQGSRGLDIDQGAIDTAIRIPSAKGEVGQKVDRIKTGAQGSHAHLGYKAEKVSRERV
jgi:hypothetical protein